MLNLKKKKVLIMGLGLHGGGAGVVKFFANHGAELTVTDLRSRKDLLPTLRLLKNIRGIRYVFGRHRTKDFISAHLIVKNPGVKPDSPYLKSAREKKIPVTSELGIFFRLCPAKIIGVTGTRGKSTTAYLIWKFLQKHRSAHTGHGLTQKSRVFLGGNIRKSALEFLPKLKKDDWTILEISSFQLQDLASEKTEIPEFPPLRKKSPEVAVLTNIMNDHLNWHSNFAEYVKSKSCIFKFQKRGDSLFINPDDPILKRITRNASSRVITPKLSSDLQKIVREKLGEHYLSSVALAVSTAKHLGAFPAEIRRILLAFKGLEGREELIAKIRGINFINDTTSTTPDATVAALKRFRKIAGKNRLILIAGGTDKKLDFKEMANAIKKYAEILVFLPGTATQKIKNKISEIKKIEIPIKSANNMQEAVRLAYGIAKEGDFIILSPGAASFGLFLNEFDRGNEFVKAVGALKAAK